MNGRPGRNIRDMILGIDQDLTDSDLEELDREAELLQSTDGEACAWTRESLYVSVPERAINNIQKQEAHLFTEEEWCLLEGLGQLEYHPRFIFFRLTKRKSGKWFRVADMKKYISEVGQDGLVDAMEKLSKPLKPVPEPMEVDDGIIDLTLDSDDEDAQPVAGPSNLRPQVTGSSNTRDDEVRLDYFCQDEESLSLFDGLHILKVDEVKSLCKTLKIQHTKLNKDQMIGALMDYSSKQSTLNFAPSPQFKGKGKAKSGLRQTTLSFTTKQVSQDQTSRLKQLMLKVLGKTVKVNPHLHTLMVRLHIIWFRSTEFPDSLFHDALLAGFKKLTFAEYDHVRDPDIWRTREQYLDYERGLQIEAAIDELLKSEPKFGRATKAPATDIFRRFITPGTPGFDFIRALTTPACTPGVQPDGSVAPDGDEVLEFDVAEDTPAQQNARIVKTILEEHVWPKWKELVSAETEATRERKPGLERFEAGFLYARIVRKSGEALATLKEFAAEKELLDSLLNQRLWRRGRRGAWYERRALLQMTYLYKNSDGTKNMDVLWDARDGIIEALDDTATAMVFRPSLIRRLDRVEKMLKLFPEQKAKHDDVILEKPDEVSFTAIRVWDHPDSVKLDASGRIKGKENKTADGTPITNYFVVPDTPAGVSETAKTTKWRWTGKSLWQGKDGTVNVETRALQYYDEVHGFKGFHSETQVLTTLFGLLFWDIIFAQIPGAFETPWQVGPLDIGEDTFYYARRERIEARLTEIKNGQARTILAENDERYRENKTCCIGVSWDVCGREDLIEIVECLSGESLSSICRLFCEDYRGRCSGVPDLIVWNPETKECKFVEVKGPGDSLQENQKLWSDALINARCAVEVCHVLDSKAKKKVKKEKATPKPRGKSRSATASTSRAVKGKARAEPSSVKPDSDAEEESELLQIISLVGEDDDAWTPSAEIRDLPPRETKRRRRTVDDDELPLFSLESDPSTPATVRKRHPEILTSPSKKRKTI
ncbi:Fanconi-associated nuclease [Mycena venus]|uniref:Fanconi-associated nuclease n=1 Tax=Mycena venus TaxID=2733690 RepID=A0A8H7D5L1_9AGAR|nr:Fanconi-associated nuclease [Mycena venus]